MKKYVPHLRHGVLWLTLDNLRDGQGKGLIDCHIFVDHFAETKANESPLLQRALLEFQTVSGPLFALHRPQPTGTPTQPWAERLPVYFVYLALALLAYAVWRSL